MKNSERNQDMANPTAATTSPAFKVSIDSLTVTRDKGQVMIGNRSPAFRISKNSPVATKDKRQVMIGNRSPAFRINFS